MTDVYFLLRNLEGVMAYNTLKAKVREFLQPFADEKRVVGADDVRKYFEELRGDLKSKEEPKSGKPDSDHRQEQSGKFSSYFSIQIPFIYE